MRINKLDGLRGLFSIMIVLVHYNYLPFNLQNFFLIKHSYSFVDFFFVLSGFVITYKYQKITNFYKFKVYITKRFVRLFPLLLYTSIIYLLCIFIRDFLILNFYPILSNKVITYNSLGLNFLNNILFLNSTNLIGPSNINGPSWSISSEMISYIFFGMSSVFIKNSKIKIRFFILTMIFILLFFINQKTFFYTSDFGFCRGLYSFLLGFFVFKINQINFKIPSFFEYFLPFFLTINFYMLDVLSNDISIVSVLFESIILPFFFGISIIVFLKTNGLISNYLEMKYFQYLGKISYSIYLNHAIFVDFALNLIFKAFNIELTPINQIIVFILIVAAIIIYSNYTYKYIEIQCKLLLSKYLL